MDSIESKNNKYKIAIYAICKNESQFVDRWIASMNEADYIVVLDTGSTDNTYKKLLEYKEKNPIKFIIEQKTYDYFRFDTARNDALALCPEDTDIYFSTDLDEVLDPGWYDIIQNTWIEGGHSRGHYTYIWSHAEDGIPEKIFTHNKIHTKYWHWIYPVHECLANNEDNTMDYYMSNCANLDRIILHHYPDDNKSRARYLELLELRCLENPDDPSGFIYLGREYLYRKHPEKCIFTLNYVLKYQNKLEDIEISFCYLYIANAYKSIGYFVEAMDNYNKAIDVCDTYIDPYIEIGKLLLENEKYNICIGYINEGLNKAIRKYSWLEEDRSWLDAPYNILSSAYYCLGDKSNALINAIKASNKLPCDKMLSNNVDKILKEMNNNA